jgi:hypothetical protein
MPGTRSNDARHSAPIGTRRALVNRASQIRHPAGKNRLTIASLTCASIPRTACRRTFAALVDELPPAMPTAIYSYLLFN